MAVKKITAAAEFLNKFSHLFRCPICHEPMTAVFNSLRCASGHEFDLSKKGTLYFLNHQIKTEYGTDMLAARGRMIRSGLFQPLITLIQSWLPQQSDFLLDVGCGEGSFLTQLATQQPGAKIGFDISKPGIYLASNQPSDQTLWAIADLTNLPFADQSATTILNIFSPSHYQEFARVLQPDGTLIKVIPGSQYLQELRHRFLPDEKIDYSNHPVQQRLNDEATILQQQHLHYTYPLKDTKHFTDLMAMSPLEWQASNDQKAELLAHPFAEITIDLEVIQAKFH